MFDDPDTAPMWAVKFGGEFWRRQTASVAEDEARRGKGVALVNPPFNVEDVIERVDHALETDPATGIPQVVAGNYTARFDGQGLQFSPSKPSQAGAAGNPPPGQYGPAAGKPVADPATEILFQTASIERDGQAYFLADQNATEWSVTGNTAQGLLSTPWGLVEHYEAGNNGVAVTWVLQQPLPGTGPIEISATVAGLNYAGATEQGQHFADQSGVARVCVGQAFAVDSLGNRWQLTTRPSSDGSSKLIVELPAAVQNEAVYPLAVDPIISPEFGMDVPVSIAASGNQQNAAITSGGGMFFVVWQDNRNSVNTGTDIYGTRVSSAGVIMDPLGIAVCTTGTAQNTPAVAFSGKTFLAVWQDTRLGGNDIFGARVLSSGVLLDPLGIPISFDPAQNPKANPSVAGSPAGFFAVWEDNRNSATATDIYGARINAAGVVLDPAGVPVCTNAANEFHPTVVANGTNYFVAWEDDRNIGTSGRDIYGGRVTGAGIPQDGDGAPLSTAASNQTEPVAAINQGTILVAWRDRRNAGGTGNDIYGTRVDFKRNIVNALDTNGIAICTNAAAQQTPAVSALTNGFLVVWMDQRNSGITGDDIYGARLDNKGNLLDPGGISICTNTGNQTAPAVASLPSGALVVWTDPRNVADTGNDIFGARVSLLGVVQNTNGIVVSKSGAEESAPAVAFNGTNYLVAWQDERNFTTNSTDIRGARVSSTGGILDSKGINICAQSGAQRSPAVGASGGEFLVAWEDARNALTTGVDIYATRVSGSGAVLDPAGLDLSSSANNQLAPSVAGNQSTFLVAWDDSQNAVAPGIYGTLVNQSGLISNPGGFAIAAATGGEMFPSIAANSNQFLVAFEDATAGDVFASRVMNNGTVLDPSGSALQLASNGSELTPAAASLGTNYLVAWMDERNSGNSGSDIYAARVFGDGTMPDSNNSGFPICTLPNNQISPAVSADSSTYVVVWQNQGFTEGNDLASARVATNGTVLDMWTMPLAGTADRMAPELAYGGAGKFLLVSDGFRSNSGRVAANLMTGAPPLANMTVQFSSAAYSVAETGKFAKISVSVIGKYSGEVAVDFATADGTGVAGRDYMPVAGRLVFSSGKKSATVLVPIIDDGTPEANKTVNLTLQNPMGGVLLGATPTATLTILE